MVYILKDIPKFVTEAPNCAFPNTWFAGMNSLEAKPDGGRLKLGLFFSNLRIKMILAPLVHTLIVQWI